MKMELERGMGWNFASARSQPAAGNMLLRLDEEGGGRRRALHYR